MKKMSGIALLSNKYTLTLCLTKHLVLSIIIQERKQTVIRCCCNMQDGALPAINYYHKALHLGCCSSPISASGNGKIETRTWLEKQHRQDNYPHNCHNTETPITFEYLVQLAIIIVIDVYSVFKRNEQKMIYCLLFEIVWKMLEVKNWWAFFGNFVAKTNFQILFLIHSIWPTLGVNRSKFTKKAFQNQE